MFSLTAREQTLLVIVLAATLLGAAVKHWRAVRRERTAESAALHASPGAAPASGRAGNRKKPAHPAEPSPTPQVALAEETAAR